MANCAVRFLPIHLSAAAAFISVMSAKYKIAQEEGKQMQPKACERPLKVPPECR